MNVIYVISTGFNDFVILSQGSLTDKTEINIKKRGSRSSEQNDTVDGW